MLVIGFGKHNPAGYGFGFRATAKSFKGRAKGMQRRKLNGKRRMANGKPIHH